MASLAVALLPAAPAGAHAVLIGASPSPNIGLGTPPRVIRLRLSEPLRVPPSAIRVLDRNGRDFAVSVRRLASDPQSMEASLRPTGRGVYKVEWKSVSVLDGHTIRGVYFFGVGQAPPGAPAQTQSGPLSGAGVPGILARIVQDAALLVLLGLAALALLAGGSRFEAEALRLLPAVGLVASAGALATAAAEGVAAAGWSLAGVYGFLSGAVAGWARLVIVAASLAALGACAAKRSFAVAALASVALVGVAISGHAAATTHPLPYMAANAAHLVFVGVWLGGTAAIALVWWRARPSREEIVRLVARASPFAIASAVAVAATGAVNALGQLDAPSDLWRTGYGAVVLGKAAALSVAGASGVRHSFVLRRRLAAASPDGARSPARGIRRAVGGEGWTGLAAVVLAALLVAIPDPPAQEARAEEQGSTVPAIFAAGREPFVTVAERDGDHVVGLVIAPPRPGKVKLIVQIVAGGDIDLDRLGVSISATGPGGSIAERMAPCGPGCFMAAARLDAAGTWTFSVRADDPDGTAVSLRIPLPVPDGSAVYERLRRAWDALRSVQIDERFRGPNDFAIDSRYRYQGPDRATIETSTGRTEIDIGERSYTRISPRGPWTLGRNPFPARVPFSFPWQRATEEPRLLEDTVVEGRPATVLALFDPFGIWYRIAVDKRTSRPLEDRMRAVGHFMDRSYSRFDEALGIRAPRI